MSRVLDSKVESRHRFNLSSENLFLQHAFEVRGQKFYVRIKWRCDFSCTEFCMQNAKNCNPHSESASPDR